MGDVGYHGIWRSENFQAASPDWEDITMNFHRINGSPMVLVHPLTGDVFAGFRRRRRGASAAGAGQALAPVADRQLAGSLSLRSAWDASWLGGASRGFARRPRRRARQSAPDP